MDYWRWIIYNKQQDRESAQKNFRAIALINNRVNFMDERLDVKWGYSPQDFFEEPFLWEGVDYKIVISDGTVIVNLESKLYEEDTGIISKISKEIEAIFYGVQIFRFQIFDITLNNYTITKYNPNGTQNSTIAVSSQSAYTTAESVDIKISNDEGRIIADTKAMRLKEEQEIALLAAKYRNQDDVAKSILDSYNSAIKNPDHELFHLYEIRDALIKKFDNEKGVRDYLNISRKKINRLRILANREPLIEGRKRGDHVWELRHATKHELEEARGVAKQLIINYLKFLDGENLFKSK